MVSKITTPPSQNDVINKINELADAGFVTNTDYATNNTAGVIKTSTTYSFVLNSSGVPYVSSLTYAQYTNKADNAFISKGTLENVLTGKGTLTSSGVKTIDGQSIVGTGNINISRNIGEIIASTIPLTDSGLHLLDGALLSGSGSYAEFVTYIASIYDASANYFCTEAQWQAEVTNTGVCGKFVYDSVNNTVRLPKYNNKIWTGDGRTPVIGDGKALGFYNSLGLVYEWGNGGLGIETPVLGSTADAYGATAGTSVTNTYEPDDVGKAVGITTDSTKSGLTADLSGLTTAMNCYYYIVVASSAKTDIQVDIDNIATDLNGKCDKDGTNATFPHITESYINGTSGYIVYSNGFCEQWGVVTSGENVTNTIYFTKSYIDSNYNVLLTQYYYASAYNANPLVYSTSTGNMTILGQANAVYWRVAGYIR